MEFPVDILRYTSHEDLEICAEEYMHELIHRDLDQQEYFTLPNNKEVLISLSSVGYVPLYGSDQAWKILALFTAENPLSAVALYLVDHWWAVDDILKTSDNFRSGLIQVKSLGERIVLYVLNRIIYREQEISKYESPFLCHSSKEYAKILWEDGQAIGFFSVKTTGSKCYSFLTKCYELPVLDSLFVRKNYRGRNYGLQMLEDFVDSFTDDILGLRYPLPLTMYKVCKQYLEKYPSDQDLLWEVEGAGHLLQRTNIARKLQTQAMITKDAKMSQKKEHIAKEEKEQLLNSSEEIAEISEQNSETCDINIATEVNAALEENEENIGLTDSLPDVPKDSDTTPVSARTRSSDLRQPKLIRTTELGRLALNSEPETMPETHMKTVSRSKAIITEEPFIRVEEQREDRTQEATIDNIAEHSTDEKMPLKEISLLTTDVQNSSWEEEIVMHESHKAAVSGSVTEETIIQEHTRCNLFSNVPHPPSDEHNMEAVAEPVVTEPEASPLHKDLISAGDAHIIISSHNQEKTVAVESRETTDDQLPFPDEPESAKEEPSSNATTSSNFLEASSASSFLASNTSASEEDLSFQEESEAMGAQNKRDLEEVQVNDVSLQELEEQKHSTSGATKKVIKCKSQKAYLSVPMRRQSLWREAKAGKATPLKKRKVD